MQKIKDLWTKYREYILYLFVGGLTTLVSYGVYFVCARPLSLSVVASNAVSWVFSVTVAYILNKIWVFEHKSKNRKDLFREIGEFILARIFTFIIETSLLWLTVDIFKWNDLLMKVVVSVVTVVLNYVFSKFIIFKTSKLSSDTVSKNTNISKKTRTGI